MALACVREMRASRLDRATNRERTVLRYDPRITGRPDACGRCSARDGAGLFPSAHAGRKPDLQGMWTNSSITTLERNNQALPSCSTPSR